MLAAAETTVERRAIRVRGAVQGVGFRPFVYRLAHELGGGGQGLGVPGHDRDRAADGDAVHGIDVTGIDGTVDPGTLSKP